MKNIFDENVQLFIGFEITGSLRAGKGVCDFLLRRGGGTGNKFSPFGGNGGFTFDCSMIACEIRSEFVVRPVQFSISQRLPF